jgi:hypothetical protein
MFCPLSEAAQSELLRSIVERSRPRAGQPRPVVVFDLDGTLFDNRPRTAAILKAYAEKVRHSAVDLAERLSAVRPENVPYLLTDTLARIGITAEHEIEALREHWVEHFFVDGWLHHDVALPGAVAFARGCWENGASLVYLTGRDLPKMALGSFASLRDSGFPIGVPGTSLVCKPDPAIADERYKREVCPEMARVGEVIASFDNEPGNCNAFLEHFPEAASVLLATQHAPNPPTLATGCHTILDFRF